MSYQDVKDKLYHGHRKVANNTYLQHCNLVYAQDDEWIEMKLHGHTIAKFYPDHLELYSAGHYTTTTKNRLNLALQLANIDAGIFQKNWDWYVSIPQEDSVPFKNGMRFNY